MKKRWMTTILAIMLMLATLGAKAEEPGVIVQSSCSIVPSGDYYLVYCYAQVHNNSDQIICLDEGTLALSDGEQLLCDQEVAQLWPYFLNPGEDGYLFDIVSFEPGENGPVMPNVTNLSYHIRYMTIDPVYGGKSLQVEPEIVTDEHSGEVKIVCRIINATQEIAYDPSVAFGLYTQAGQMIYADGMTVNSVGIPAGGELLVRFGVDKAFVDQWNSYGATPAHVRVNAMFRNNED